MADMDYRPAEEFVYDEPERTSILAILSLIASLICFIPLIGVLGALLGVFALFRISSSGGRVKGTGLAVAGIIIGLIFSTVWIGIGFAIQSAVSQIPQVANVMVDIENDAPDAVRSGMDPRVHSIVTDDQIDSFRAEYQAAMGSFIEVPRGLGNLFGAYASLGQSMNALNSPQAPYTGETIPIPGTFDQGEGLLLLAFDQSSAQRTSGATAPAYINVGVLTPNDGIIWLYDPATPIAATAGSEALPGSEDAESGEVETTDPESPSDENPAEAEQADPNENG